MSTFSGPLSPQQWEILKRLAEDLSPEQRLWVSGYLAGFGGAEQKLAPSSPPQTAEPPSGITVLFGSQTGNAQRIAKALHARLQQSGISARLEDMATYKSAQLRRDRCLFVIVSTHGEGEPPDSARPFYEFLFSKKAPKLDGLQFSVLALGDTSYEHFCKTGREFDSRLEDLGASRCHPRIDCDVDYEEAAEAWMKGVLEVLTQSQGPRVEISTPAAAVPVSVYSKKQPFPAVLLDNLRLTGRGSTKDVRHIELSIEGSGLRFEPGDALGVLPTNRPETVADLMESLGLDPGAIISAADGAETTLEDALLHHYEITTLTRPFLENYAALSGSTELRELLKDENRDRLRDFVYGREIIDVVRRYPVSGIMADHFVATLRKLPPRLYSIASSQNADPDEVHLTVAVVRYESHGVERHGVASTFLADRVPEGEKVPVYVDSNPNFRLPEDPDAPIIMVGPGTGVAPFRAFLAEREVMGARGKNWLFFGDRNFRTDFLYQREWLAHRKNGLLTRIDVAFSRDDDAKVYVQHRMLEQSRQLYAWLEEGAYFYVCGDAKRMAPDVHEALISVVQKEAGVDRERAEDYVRNLQTAKRYRRDVY
ncbi:assimilatory sulfite reductase (NADPH) flavoprotein subunit [Methylocaldum szegediense]|uniref:Sulfite reductase [NADPH] flavoprotein alpha-component n=1 Tax=Methylocaldum szegediense TaxID=73780 RepID=A0ABM9I9D9_9GAMM|nr:assimilatory sulfite reductase (NADPH) flavoprotein subunit [Methylocaldum szegediense]CAI8972804.1 sulfite reductase, flavoprotein subunit [Methylocaldum szegediense]